MEVITREWTITDIETASEKEIAERAEEMLNIKGFQVYLIDIAGHFGYSAIVFGNGRQIKYANDYELHHAYKTKEELKSWYIETLNNKLFTEDQLKEKITTYTDYKNKDYFIRNYYPLQFEHLSMFHIFHNEAEEMLFDQEQKKNYPYPCGACFAYFKKQSISNKINDMLIALQFRLKETENDFEYWKSAFKYEMYNHEYCINWQADYDVIGCFSRSEYYVECASTEDYLKHSGLNEIQQKAYMAAKKEYYNEIKECDF